MANNINVILWSVQRAVEESSKGKQQVVAAKRSARRSEPYVDVHPLPGRFHSGDHGIDRTDLPIV